VPADCGGENTTLVRCTAPSPPYSDDLVTGAGGDALAVVLSLVPARECWAKTVHREPWRGPRS
jgi:hypothetical protein